MLTVKGKGFLLKSFPQGKYTTHGCQKKKKKRRKKQERYIYILKIVKTYVLKLWNAVWSCSALDGNFFCQQDNLISKSFLNCTRISIFQMSISIAFMRTFPEKKLKFVTYDHTCILKMHNVYDDYLRYVGGKKIMIWIQALSSTYHANI